MTPAEKKSLRAIAKGRSKAEMKVLFALVRAKTDKQLLAAIAPPKKKAAAKRGDPVAKDVEHALRPILGPSAEKAELLVEHMAKKYKKPLTASPKGIADAVRRLKAEFSDAQIRAGAKGLIAELATLYGTRETVV